MPCVGHLRWIGQKWSSWWLPCCAQYRCKANRSRFTIIFSHGNAEDLGTANYFCQVLRSAAVSCESAMGFISIRFASMILWLWQWLSQTLQVSWWCIEAVCASFCFA